jgi:hypothetical protein
MNLKEKYNKRKIIIIFKEKKRRSIEKWGRKEKERERERKEQSFEDCFALPVQRVYKKDLMQKRNCLRREKKN